MRVGNYAERRTGRELRRHPAVLAAVSTIEFDHRDIDHVIVTGSAVCAVEVKYCTTAPGDDRVTRDLNQLAEEVRKTRLLLMSKEIRDLRVCGLLVYWGSCPEIAQGRPAIVDEATTLLHITDLASWLDAQNGDVISGALAAQIGADVESYAQLRASAVRAKGPRAARA